MSSTAIEVTVKSAAVPRPRRRGFVVLPCLFASGAVSLIYEVCWIRQATLVFGATTLAVSTVVGVFFAGMALGSYLFGRWAQRTRRPLWLYAVVEAALAVVAASSPWAFRAGDTIYGWFYPQISDSFALLSLCRFLLISVILMAPAILMGGTLPLFCRQFVRHADKVSLSVGLLYGLNTLGAVVGCAVCGFVLLPAIGANQSVFLGAAINLGIALFVWMVAGRAVVAEPPPSESTITHDTNAADGGKYEQPSARARHWIFGLFFVSGFVILGNEILWTRFLSLLIRNSVYTYTLTLAIILVGIVLGSVLTAGLYDHMRRKALAFGLIQVLAGLSVLLVAMIPAGWWHERIGDSLTESLWAFLLVLMPPATLSGMLFPLAIRMVVDRPEWAALGVGKMTAINTLGGILGSLLVGFYLLPAFGLHTGILITTGLSVVAGFVAWLVLERGLKPVFRLALVGTAAASWIAIPWWFGTRLPADLLAERGALVAFREGLTGHLAVVDNQDVLQLEIDRLWQGENRKSHQIMAAYIPMLLHPDPRRVAVVGVGAGQTCSRFLMYDIERLDCVDIESRLFGLIRKHFDGGWLDDPRVRILIEDGRNHLTHTDERYDVISLEIGQIFRPGVASFYTVQFYERSRQRLEPGGLLCQFVPIPFFSPEEFRSAIATFQHVFPQSVLWYNTSELLLIGSRSDEPLRTTEKRLKGLMGRARVARDLAYAHWGGREQWLVRPGNLLGGFLMGPEGLRSIADGAPIYTDDRPRLEYSAALVRKTAEPAIVELLKQQLEPVTAIVAGSLDEEIEARAHWIREWNLRDILASAIKRTADELPDDAHERRVDLYTQAHQWNEKNVEISRLLGDSWMVLGQPGRALEPYREAIAEDPADFHARHGLGRALHVTGQLTEAVEHYAEAARLDRQDPHVRNNIGVALAARGDVYKAIAYLEEAVRLAPDFLDARVNYAQALFVGGCLKEAAEQYRVAIRHGATTAAVHTRLGQVLARMGELEEAREAFRSAMMLDPESREARAALEDLERGM